MTQVQVEPTDVAGTVLAENDAISLATTGGEYSPWILGAYFARETSSLDLLLFLEEGGKSMANVRKNPRVAFSISKNDAQQDFVQGRGLVEIADEPTVRSALLAKMPWYKTYTPVVPIRIRVEEMFVSSLARGWFPARRIVCMAWESNPERESNPPQPTCKASSPALEHASPARG